VTSERQNGTIRYVGRLAGIFPCGTIAPDAGFRLAVDSVLKVQQ
jgi:hypothetical protein